MSFIDQKTSREAQAARNAIRDKKGRPAGKYETPDREGTYLAWSATGRSDQKGPQTALGAALAAAGIESKPPHRSTRKRAQKPRDNRPKARPVTRVTVNPAEAMRRMAAAGKPASDKG